MSDTIMVKPGELSARLLRKAISSLEKANSTLKSLTYRSSYDCLEDVYYSCKGGAYRLFSNSTTGLMPADVEVQLGKLQAYSAILDTCPERFETIDKSFKKEIKDWRKSGKHDKVLWTTTGGAGTGKNTKVKGRKTSEGIHLQHNMGGYSTCQMSYEEFCSPYGYNAGCCATAYAIGLSIRRGEAYDPTQFWYSGTTHYKEGGCWEPLNMDAVKEELVAGKPVMFQMSYDRTDNSGNVTHDGEHWVIITGVKEGADLNNLTYADLEVINPDNGQEESLDYSLSKYSNATGNGMLRFD